MSVFVSTKLRSNEEEIMDDLNYNDSILYDTLDKLAQINLWLGGNKVTINGLKRILKNHTKKETITIVDLGCGGGDILREISVFGKKNGFKFHLIGIDANPHTINYAQTSTEAYDNIEYKVIDVFSEAFYNLKYDIVIATLFLHHFKNEDIISLLSLIVKKAKLGLVINDLHRHKLAYYLFKLLSITIKNDMVVNDGLISILRGFKKEELSIISKALNVTYTITWKWAFRYQWLIKK